MKLRLQLPFSRFLAHHPYFIDPIRVEPAGRRDGNSLCVSIIIKRLLLLECLQKVKKALLNAQQMRAPK
jgi:hypothetical protein